MKTNDLTRALRHLVVTFAALVVAWVAPLANAQQKRSSAPDSYRIQPMDLIRLQVFQETDLDRDLRVSKSYTVSLPLVGTVDLRGRTITEAERLITALYKRDFLVNPQVNLTVLEYAPRSINVLGAVNAPGQVVIPLETQMTLLDAVSRSGGFSRVANRSRVVVTRTRSDGSTENYTVNADDLMTGASDERWIMKSGDVIFVPESIL